MHLLCSGRFYWGDSHIKLEVYVYYHKMFTYDVYKIDIYWVFNLNKWKGNYSISVNIGILNNKHYFEQVRPHLEFTFANILSHINTIYVLKTRPDVMCVDTQPEYRSLRLKGQMLYVPETDLVIFLCYPSVMNLDDLTRYTTRPIFIASTILFLFSWFSGEDYSSAIYLFMMPLGIWCSCPNSLRLIIS